MTGGRNFAPDRWLEEGDTVSIGDLSFDICTAPATRPAAWCSSTRTTFRPCRRRLVRRLGRAHRSARRQSRHADQLDQDQAAALGDDVGFICGHGAGSSIGQERMTNPFITGEM